MPTAAVCRSGSMTGAIADGSGGAGSTARRLSAGAGGLSCRPARRGLESSCRGSGGRTGGDAEGAPPAPETVAAIPTFAEAAARVIELRRPTWRNWRHAAQWQYTLNYSHACAWRYDRRQDHHVGRVGRSGADMDVQDGNGHAAATEDEDGLRLVHRTRPPSGR